MRHIVKTVFLILGKIGFWVAFLIFGLWFTLNTTLGADLIFKTLSWVTPWSIQYKALEGSLLSSLHFFDLSMRSSTMNLSAQRLDIDWDFHSLWGGTLHIRNFQAAHVGIEPHISPSGPQKNFTLSEIRSEIHEAIPFPLRIDNFLATDVAIKTKKTILLKHFSFNSANTTNSFVLNNLTVEGSFGQIKLEADQAIHAQWNIAIPDLSLWWNDLKGDFRSMGKLDIRDIEQPLDSTIMELEVLSQSLVWNDLPFKDLKIHHKGSLKKTALSLEGIFKDHLIKTHI
ncbi:MAG TPA: hypothetical protein VFP93_04275, partial [Gammaproteobacteria bacterium]|nr:hypothetical protein [Gammaproteobacteria bacterium]